MTQAVSRTEAQSQKAATKVKEEKDVRNLFLAREGCKLLQNGSVLSHIVEQIHSVLYCQMD